MTKRRQQTGKKPQNNRQSGFVRIISGQWRGRKLPVHDVEGLRPTTDRVKETLFNWLAQDIYQAKCLDLFAGSGSLSFEALSRGAESLTMIELDQKAAAQLKQNLTAIGATNATLHNTNSVNFLNQAGTPHDLVFIDPPFRKDLIQQVITALEANHWLSPNALIYIEAEKELGSIDVPPSWHLYREKTAGQVCYRLFIREEEE
ncbi:TPA: 16S rRNA (guanine(966)-N(2))-methyltransferase RsmD [Photobacterium damselae]|uniref:16S rRNA (Guanine(966)-N(2))-methyltransferase RsmD n=1 Tax=Photobacterium damselae TaxID=38293 RepID=A0ACD3SXR8_PHODM|nr:16S rRNA (guanine(966)-N(2))-methyltransferase RsmD [Photobacterium damselae]AWK80709.1 16S rRNA (guanine(966)-N(2))-methyltransferase RsmD [Photobacterium damselae]EHA1081014.1 16S rRNA (guanine(966)-N(2))-methyltransferase RsmD [Photobacterium damselae]ELI6447645.1 16S rRNA (guanine(966)-N(2))-methyltransferase RsmD [Photobacterium damselae]ELV7516671.1 16S rRNA (guanine(966)-N(2))-methyltransferase RsmD [Photobacterium damselae]MCG3812621.1 16S rRNA (guanine(966)-N(2))-methyltransferase 